MNRDKERAGQAENGRQVQISAQLTLRARPSAEQVCILRFAGPQCAESSMASSRAACATTASRPVREENSARRRRQIGVITEKFHPFGWTVPIRPTYCPDEKIFDMDDEIERQGVWRHQGISIDRFVGLSASSAPRLPVF